MTLVCRILCSLAVALGVRTPVAVAAPATQPALSRVMKLADHLSAPANELRDHEAERDRLEAIGASAPLVHDAIQAQLAWANWLLAVPTARPATRWLIGVDRPEDLRTIALLAADAGRSIDHVRAIPAIVDEAWSPEQQERLSELMRAADVLEPFAELFEAANTPDDGQRSKALAAAARRLGAARESDDTDLASCALLWQSFGFAQAGRHKRALLSLPDALAPPEQWPFDFACRLLRCRVLADTGQHPAATALAIRLQAQCQPWYPREPVDEIRARRRLAALVQCRAIEGWLAELDADDTAAKASLESMLAGIENEQFSDTEHAHVCTLDTAVPILVKPPAIRVTPFPPPVPASNAADAPTTQPTTTGTSPSP